MTDEVKKKHEKFNVMKNLRKFLKEKHARVDGVIIAFTMDSPKCEQKGSGCLTITANTGAELRLLEEAKIQQLKLDKNREIIAIQEITNNAKQNSPYLFPKRDYLG